MNKKNQESTSKLVIKNPVISGTTAAANQGSSTKKDQFYQTMFKNLNQNGLVLGSREGSATRPISKTSLRVQENVSLQKNNSKILQNMSRGEGSAAS